MHCGKRGHLEATCWEKDDSLKPTCGFCKVRGHYESRCHKKREAEEEKESNREESEGLALVCAYTATTTSDKNFWIADFGSTTHVTGLDLPLVNIRPSSMVVSTADGSQHNVKHVGDLLGTFVGGDGSHKPLTLKDVYYSPTMSCNLFSLKTALSNGFGIGNKGITMYINKGKHTFWFKNHDQMNLSGFHFLPRQHQQVSLATISKEPPPKTMDINIYHQAMGHINEQVLKRTANKYAINLTGKLNPCVACMKANFKTLPLNKQTSLPSTSPGHRIHLDLAALKAPSLGGASFWLLLVDDYTKFKWSVFLKHKSDLAHKANKLLIHINKHHPVQYLRMDNAGENQALQKVLEAGDLQVKVEYTSPDTPQQNGVAERGFASIQGAVRSMLFSTAFSRFYYYRFWAEAVSLATCLDNHKVRMGNSTSASTAFLGKNSPKLPFPLIPFGCPGIKKTGVVGFRKKLDARGDECYFMGYSPNHSSQNFRFYNPVS